MFFKKLLSQKRLEESRQAGKELVGAPKLFQSLSAHSLLELVRRSRTLAHGKNTESDYLVFLDLWRKEVECKEKYELAIEWLKNHVTYYISKLATYDQPAFPYEPLDTITRAIESLEDKSLQQILATSLQEEVLNAAIQYKPKLAMRYKNSLFDNNQESRANSPA
ncbi:MULTISPECIES: hypothetical protein [Legionella]|uniref:Uncharacterized protein n=1 Tax=Legionella septentrionalis TaxID=2498109 RepID=A0A433JI09_9GAMM|nr:MULTISPECIES: hypothetical protein [Legionella]MCP0913768.1 hypothetical protein [Legionella sp. 27cVA30]RUQ84499.1 hypothetical protein EKM59_08620 [Legionella septentrionalis]RUQ96452.1 hypothetical protein ELY11_07970 [Legionella septentrionalis]RUR09697.1 hypothetical protein ELY14_07800 [Legionella septentrionalis]RUR14533.1 hypothetical protein ELY10_08425 [Legionella septentrionalis]